MSYSMFGKDFVEYFEDGGIRDEYYRKRFHKCMPMPKNQSGDNGSRIYTPKHGGISYDNVGRVSVRICNEGELGEKMSIEDAVDTVRLILNKK